MPSTSLTPADRRWLQVSGGCIVIVPAALLAARLSHSALVANWIRGPFSAAPTAAVALLVVGLGLFAIAGGARRVGFLCGLWLCAQGGVELAWKAAFSTSSLQPFHAPPVLHGPPLVGSLTQHLGVMALDTAIALVLVGVMFCARAISASWRNVFAALAGVIGALAFLPMLQFSAWYLTSGNQSGFHGMAVPTSLCLILFAGAIIRVERTPSEGGLSFMSAAVGMMFSIGFAGVRSNGDLLAANRIVEHTYQVRAAISAFVEQVARAESSTRGYALTGAPYFRERVAFHEQEAAKLLSDLEQRVSDNPAQIQRIGLIRDLTQEKARQNARLLSARTAAGAPAAAEYLNSLLAIPGRPSSNLVIAAAEMGTVEETLLAQRTRDQFSVEQATRLVQAVGSLFAGGLLLSAILVTRRASAARREAEAQFRGSFEDAGIGMALVALDGRWLRMNRSVLELLGYSHDELAGRTFHQITHPDDLAADLSLLKELIAGRGRTYQLEKRYFHRDGHIVWANLTVSIVRTVEGKPLHFISQIEDITARKRLEEELRTARDEALAAARVKSEFLATMSHEIRTPLNGVLGMTHLLLDSPLSPAQKEMAQTVESSGENLLRVLNDVLDFSTMEAGRMSLIPSWFSLHDLIGQTLALYAPVAARKSVALESRLAPETAGQFWADPGRLTQVLNNLVGNALKFTERGGVTVSAAAAGESEGRAILLITVTDTGIGIAAEDQGRLFRTFSQVDSSDRRKYGGTGLGLAICKRIVELMGGEIGLKSEPGAGSAFWFRVSLRRNDVQPAVPAADARPAAARAPAGARVLVAEDNVTGQLVARLTLTRMGYSVDLVASGEEVFAQLAKARYDAVLMDCQMPGMDGLETTRRIRQGQVPGVDPQIPIIALTAAAFAEDRARCLAAGMNEYLSKPVRTAELAAALARVGRGAHLPAAG